MFVVNWSDPVASKSKIAAFNRTPKFTTRLRRRCKLCGRPRGVYRKFGICRICFRKMADQGIIPGVRKASW
jgi:small subunit ribosomal protein S14